MDGQKLLDNFGISLTEFNNFIAKRLRSYKLPRSIRDEFLDDNGGFQEEEAFNSTAFLAITQIIDSNKILNSEESLRFILKKDFRYIQDAIYFQIVFLTKNNTIYEKITGTSVQMPNFNVQMDTSRNILTSDTLGTQTKIAIKLSEIRHYKIIPDSPEGKIYVENNQNELQVVATLDEAKLILGGTT